MENKIMNIDRMAMQCMPHDHHLGSNGKNVEWYITTSLKYIGYSTMTHRTQIWVESPTRSSHRMDQPNNE